MNIYRIQDKDGRGPFKPGFTRTWLETIKDLPAWHDEFGLDVLSNVNDDECCATGVRTQEALKIWFTKAERERLQILGYKPVMIPNVRVIAESPNQILFARKKPLNQNFKNIELN